MMFKVGPWEYPVYVVSDLRDWNRNSASGIADGVNRIIYIDADETPEGRLSVLFHELRHCWQWEMGRTTGDEDDANNVASFAIDVWRQLMAQGGEQALQALPLSRRKYGKKPSKAEMKRLKDRLRLEFATKRKKRPRCGTYAVDC